jgi:hypothetical protein
MIHDYTIHSAGMLLDGVFKWKDLPFGTTYTLRSEHHRHDYVKVSCDKYRRYGKIYKFIVSDKQIGHSLFCQIKHLDP